MKFHNEKVMHIDEISLKVKNLTVMKHFYQTVLGFKILEEKEGYVSFTVNGKDPIINLIEIENAIVDNKTLGLYHVAYLLPTRKDLASFVIHINKLGINFGAGDHLVSEAIYFEDPESNGIEVYVDRDDSKWTWDSHGEYVDMATLQVDFDDLLKENLYKYENAPSQTIIGHLHLRVNDMDANYQFYHDELGFDLVSKFGSAALFLSDAKYHHHIAFNMWSGRNLHNITDDRTGIKSYSLKTTKFDKDTILTDPNGIEILIK